MLSVATSVALIHSIRFPHRLSFGICYDIWTDQTLHFFPTMVRLGLQWCVSIQLNLNLFVSNIAEHLALKCQETALFVRETLMTVVTPLVKWAIPCLQSTLETLLKSKTRSQWIEVSVVWTLRSHYPQSRCSVLSFIV